MTYKITRKNIRDLKEDDVFFIESTGKFYCVDTKPYMEPSTALWDFWTREVIHRVCSDGELALDELKGESVPRFDIESDAAYWVVC